jgi:hypothetical protein
MDRTDYLTNKEREHGGYIDFTIDGTRRKEMRTNVRHVSTSRDPT